MLEKFVLCSVCFFLVITAESTNLCAKMIYVGPFTLVLENKTTTSANIYCNKLKRSTSPSLNPIKKNLLFVLNNKKNELNKCCNYFSSGRELYCNENSCVVSNNFENRKSMQLTYMKNKTLNIVKERLFKLIDNADSTVNLVCIKEAFEFQNNSYVKTYIPCVIKSCFICSRNKAVKKNSDTITSKPVEINTSTKENKFNNTTFAKNENVQKTVSNDNYINISKAVKVNKSTKENNTNKTTLTKNKFTIKDKWKIFKMLFPFFLMCVLSCLIITAMVWYRSTSLKINSMVKKFLVLVPSEISRNDINSIHLYENQSMLFKSNTQLKETKFDKRKKVIYQNQELADDIGKPQKQQRTITMKKQRSESESFSSEEPIYHEISDLKADDATTKKVNDYQIINKTENSLNSSIQGKLIFGKCLIF